MKLDSEVHQVRESSPTPNHLAMGRFLAMTELGGTRAKNILWQLLMLEVEPRVESGTWPPLS